MLPPEMRARSLGPVVLLLASCGAPQAPVRKTTANNARSDDAWLLGERCTAETPADPPLQVEVLAAGTGIPVTDGRTVRVNYVATLRDGGKVVRDTDNMPSEVILGSTKTICGFERALLGMRPGEQRRVVVPWQRAFGEVGRAPEIPPRADLVFVIDLYVPAEEGGAHGAPPVNPIRARGR